MRNFSSEDTESIAEQAELNSRFANFTLLQRSSPQESEEWVTTYMDLITLLLTVFIVLLAFSSGGDDSSFSQKTKAIAAEVLSENQDASASEAKAPRHSAPEQKFGDKLMANLKHSQLSEGIFTIRQENRDVRIELDSEILFESGEAALADKAIKQLKSLSDILTMDDYLISIEGHTDNIPIHTARYPSNWELSSARASRVARFFIAQGISAEKVRVIGYAHSKPVQSNETAAGRKRNRRVAIIVSENTPG